MLYEKNDFVLQYGRVVTRKGTEVEFFENEKDAGAWIQHVYGLQPFQAEQELGVKIKSFYKRNPEPGDAFVNDSYYAAGGLTTYGILECITGSLAACFNPSAFRAHHYVSCSGGPLPWILKSSLTFIGLKRTMFWRWGDGTQGAHQGGNYFMTVPLWYWDGVQGIEEYVDTR